MGITGLFSSTIGIISAIIDLGISTSSIRDVSNANVSGDMDRISRVASILRTILWLTGLVGTLATIILSRILSQWSFGDERFTFHFVWLSITLLFKQLTNSHLIFLQGMRKFHYLAKANLYGNLLGLILTAPLYYFFGTSGIVPAMIITSVIVFILAFYFFRRLKIRYINVTIKQSFLETRNMIVLGMMISLSGLASMATGYLVRIFIQRTGGIEQVGLFTAGFAILNTYVGLIFSAMGTDYFPRLSSISTDNSKCKIVINQQAEISLLFLAPMVLLFIILLKWIVVILYSSRFVPVNQMLLWAALGMFFKSASWAIAFVFMAKGRSILFFWNEILANTYVLILNIIGYFYFGLTGLGVSFMMAYLIYLVQVYLITNRKFSFSFSSDFYKILAIQLLLFSCCFIGIYYISGIKLYVLGFTLLSISTIYSIYKLDERINMKQLLLNIQRNYRKGKDNNE